MPKNSEMRGTRKAYLPSRMLANSRRNWSRPPWVGDPRRAAFQNEALLNLGVAAQHEEASLGRAVRSGQSARLLFNDLKRATEQLLQ